MAGIFKKIFGFGHGKKEEKSKATEETRAPAGGFSVKVAVPTDPIVHAPVVIQCNGNGGVQVSRQSFVSDV